MINVVWILEKRVVLYQSVGELTVDELSESVKMLDDKLNAGDPPVHVISDSRYLKKFPASIKALGSMMNRNDNAGITVVVGGNVMSKFVSKTLNQIAGGGDGMEFRDSIADAIKLLQDQDSSLPDDISYPEEPQ